MPEFQPMATDAFTGTDGTHLPAYSSSWSSNATGNAVSINTNGIVPSGSAGVIGAYRWSDFDFSPNQYSSVTYGLAASTSGNDIGPAVLIATDGSQNYYGILAHDSYTAIFFKKVAGTYTELSFIDTILSESVGLVVSSDNAFFMINYGYATSIGSDSSITEGAAGICASGASTDVRIDSWEAGNYDAGVAQVLIPSAIVNSANLSGTVSAIQDDPSSPDGTWLTAISNSAETYVEIGFSPEPGGALAGTQVFSVFLRSTSLNVVQFSVDVMEGDVTVSNVGTFGLSDTSGSKYDIVWLATNLFSDPSSMSNIKCKISCTPEASTTIEIGAVRWLAHVAMDPVLGNAWSEGTPYAGDAL